MKNTVNVHTEFDYQGKSYAPEMTLDLDTQVMTLVDVSAIPALLATANHIDSYSYQYEILLDSQLYYTDATGLAADFLADGNFDFAGFLAAKSESNIINKLQQISQDELGISDLSEHAALQRALLRAYYLDK